MARQKKIRTANKPSSKKISRIVEKIQSPNNPVVYPEVDVMITYLLSDKNRIVVTLNNGPETNVENTQMVKYTNVKSGDIIGMDGITEGKATITITVGTTCLFSKEYDSLPVHDNYTMD